MKFTNVRAMAAKAMMVVGLAAGTVALAAPQKAEAQVAFGVRVGPPVVAYRPAYRPGFYGPAYYGPRYYGPAYYGRGYYARPHCYRRGW